ncbi:MAG: trypsin-like peptidase domain-containing protein [Armatimonadota bacterium]
MKNYKHLSTGIMTTLILGSVALGAFLGTAMQRPVVVNAAGTYATADVNSGGVLATAEQLQSAFTNIADQVSPAVVTIYSEKTTPAQPQLQFPGGDAFPFPFGGDGTAPGGKSKGIGSGFIVRNDGYILTNDHVVSGADKVEVLLNDGRRFPGVVKRDFRSDIALIKINATNLPTAKLGASNSVKPGQWAIAIGSPFGKRNTITVGVVSAIGRQEEIGGGNDERFYTNLIQTDATINPGNSGGPLLNIRGEVIGVNTAIESPTGSFAGIGFAVPVDTAHFVMEQLMGSGKVVRGFLGIVPEAVTAEDEKRLGTKQGALVASINDGTPAAEAGIRVEDVIVKIGDQEVRNDLDLRDIISRTKPNTTVTMNILRQSKPMTVKVKIGEAPSVPGEGNVGDQTNTESAQKLGISVENITPKALNELGLPRDTKGVIVNGIAPGSPAQEVGIVPGDVVQVIDGDAISSVNEFKAKLNTYKSGDRPVFILRRAKSQGGDGATMRVRVSVP